MNKYFIYRRPLSHILKYKRLYSTFNNISHKTIESLSSKSPNATYWSIFQENNSFLFSLKTSESAIKDGPFISQLFKQALITTPNNNTENNKYDLIYHCYDMFQSLDMPDKLIYIKYLQKQQYYIPFLHQLYQLPNGIKYLIDLRFILLKILKQYPNEYSRLEELEIILKDKLRNWVSDNLIIQQITWQSSAEIIEKICQYEAVHAVQDINDIKRRLGPDRRVFALFSKSSPMEPLVFIHVALLPELATSIQTILQSPIPLSSSYHHRHHKIETISSNHQHQHQHFKYAICYSITTQQGLGGIHLGNHLIKYVIHQLQQSYPSLHTFATLSPIPGFRHWLLTQTNLVDQLCEIGGFHWENRIAKVPTDHPLKSKLLEFCARYILKEKRENLGGGGGGALDPVANFHLRNGACVHKLHWLGDTSRKGLNESFGIMVNYKYIPSLMDHHHQLYINDDIIMVSEKTLSCLSDYIDDHVLKLQNPI